MAEYIFGFLPVFLIIMCKKYANILSWGFRTLIKHYMSNLEQLMFASEQKKIFLRLPTLLLFKLYAGLFHKTSNRS